jgi:4'-phosphopantetheinyl transferase
LLRNTMTTSLLPTSRAIHLWLIHPTGRRIDDATLRLLPPDERDRAGRTHGVHRASFVERRTAIRGILAAYTGCQPADIAIDRTCMHCGHPQHGRPRLSTPHDVSFSTSRCTARAVVAVARREMRVAVDIEVVDAQAADAVREAALTPGERLAMRDAVDADALRLWCRKEAVLKGSGRGLVGRAVDSFDARDNPVLGWHVADLDLGDGLVGAVASTMPPSGIRIRSWPPD